MQRRLVVLHHEIDIRRPVEDPLILARGRLHAQIFRRRHVPLLIGLEAEQQGGLVYLVLQQETLADIEVIVLREGTIVVIDRAVGAVESIPGHPVAVVCPGHPGLEGPTLSERLDIGKLQLVSGHDAAAVVLEVLQFLGSLIAEPGCLAAVAKGIVEEGFCREREAPPFLPHIFDARLQFAEQREVVVMG